jgi:hypothetical protein
MIFNSPPQAIQGHVGMEMQGKVRKCKERQIKAKKGKENQGKTRESKERNTMAKQS